MPNLYLAGFATVGRGRNDNGQNGVASNWIAYRLAQYTHSGRAMNSLSRTTVAGPTSGIEMGTANSAIYEWLSPPLASNVTISGTVTFNIWAYESSMSANATVAVRLDRVDKLGAVVSTIATSSFGTELGTAPAAKNWTTTPTSTSLLVGERIRAVVYLDDATATTMAANYTGYIQFGDSVAQEADSYIGFTESLTFDAPLWESYPNAYEVSRFGFAYGNGYWLAAAGTSGVSGYTYYSANTGEGWTRVNHSTSAFLATTYGGGLYLAVGENGYIRTATAPDGTWTTRTGPDSTTALYDVIYNGSSLYVAVGAAGKIWTSANGTTGWTNQTTPSGTSNCRAVAYGNGLYVVVLNDGGIWTSSNGTSWTAQTSGTSNHLQSVAYSSTLGLWVAVGNGPIILTSSNGVNWSTATNPTTAATQYSSVIWVATPGVFVIVCNDANVCIVSSNGSTFTAFPLPPSANNDQSYRAAYNSSAGTVGFSTSTGYCCRVVAASLFSGVGKVLSLTDTASDITDQGKVEYTVWTTRGTG